MSEIIGRCGGDIPNNTTECRADKVLTFVVLKLVAFFSNLFCFCACRYLVHHTYAASTFNSNKMEDLGDAFHSMNHAERMMKKMEEYVRKRSLCDVVLVAGQRKIPAHRLVLSAASDYFAAMFTNDVQEATLEEIKIKEVDADALAAIVNFAYTGKYICLV